jgi:hypothetical protein
MNKLLLCGTVAILSQACESHDLTQLPQEDLDILESIRVEEGEKEILPLMDSLVALADDEKILGPGKNEFGHAAFSAGLWQSNDRLQEMIANGQLYYFNDPSYKHGMYYADRGILQDKEYMAINQAIYSVLDPAVTEIDWVNWVGHDAIPFDLLLHEASHDQTRNHSEPTLDACDTYGSMSLDGFSSVVFTEEHDYTMFIDGIAEEVRHNLYSVKYMKERFLYSVESAESLPGGLNPNNIFNSYEDKLERYRTPEEAAAYFAERSFILTAYLDISEHEIAGVYQREAKWHERYVEGFLVEYEAFRQEYAQEYQEWKQEQEKSEVKRELSLPEEGSSWGMRR